MRISIALLIFFILLNGWAAVLQDHGIDDQLGINAETGDPQELEDATQAAANTSVGTGGVFASIVGAITAMVGNIERMLKGLNPAAQMLSNLMPPGIAQSMVTWLFGIIEIIIAADIINFVRGTG